jgi:hypothetical protein
MEAIAVVVGTDGVKAVTPARLTTPIPLTEEVPGLVFKIGQLRISVLDPARPRTVPDDTSVLTGTSKSWVDIYGLSSGELVVLLGEPLIGTAEGNELKATWSESYENEDYSEAQDVELDGTLEAGILSGTVATTYVETSGEDTYECTVSNRFTAERTVSSPEAYPEN